MLQYFVLPESQCLFPSVDLEAFKQWECFSIFSKVFVVNGGGGSLCVCIFVCRILKKS